MKNISTVALLIWILGAFSAPVQAQVQPVPIDSVVIDTTLLVPVTLEVPSDGDDEDIPAFDVIPWEFNSPVGAQLTASDSTLRWQYWPDWTYKLNREPGVISYRLGTALRSNAVQKYAHEPRHQELFWENVQLNDPVTGTLHWWEIPQQKIDRFYEEDLGIGHRSSYYLRQYYLNEPLSKLNYSESSYTFRNLEFEVSHNLSRQTNVELSYWDCRAGGEFPNSEVEGRQIFARASHHLDERHYVKANYIHNKLDIGQPFGYVMNDMRLFPFDRFTATANQSGADSEQMSGIFSLNFYRRSADTTQTVDDLQAGIYYRGNERRLESGVDSTRYKVRTLGTTVRKWWDFDGLTMEGRSAYEFFLNRTPRNESFPRSDWGLFQSEGRIAIDYLPLISLNGGAAFHKRSDGFEAYRLNAGADFDLWRFNISPGFSTGKVMPTPQQLYWRSQRVTGNPELSSEDIREGRMTAQFRFASESTIGVRVQHKDISDGILISPDSTFENSTPYGSQSAAAFFEWNLKNFEFDGSATIHRFTDSMSEPTGSIPMSSQERVWLKGGAYWKGYLFGRAAYVKAGVSGVMVPMGYRADRYEPTIDIWHPVGDDQLLPQFDRMDVDISARVRSLVFNLRWENVLDDVNQPGYFEAAEYPMANRRFIFSVRALFRN